MNDRIRNTFDKIHAEETLKEHTREFLFQQTNGYQKRKPSLLNKGRRLALAAACLVFLLLGAGGFGLYFTPTSAVSIDINPSLELEINRFDRVITVTGYNAKGEDLADTLKIRFLNYNDALEQILTNQEILELLAKNELLSITVTGDSEAQSSRILADTQASTASDRNIYCCEGNSHEVEKAHEAGMSFGKYQAIQQLQELDPDITSEEAAGMTMSEIHHRLHQLARNSRSQTSLNESSSNGENRGSGQNSPASGQGHHGEHQTDSDSGHHGEHRNNSGAGRRSESQNSSGRSSHGRHGR